MKKIIVGSLIVSSFMFAENVASLFVDGAPTCPDLSKDAIKCYSCSKERLKEVTEERIQNLQPLISDLKKTPRWDIYEKALQNYHHTQRIDEYVGVNTWYLGILRFPIHESLENLKESINNYDTNEPKEGLEKLQNEYNRLISLIEPKNPNWCYEIANKDISKYSEEIIASYKEIMKQDEIKKAQMREHLEIIQQQEKIWKQNGLN